MNAGGPRGRWFSRIREIDPASISPMSETEAAEPCVACGEDTAIGSPFFSDRTVVDRPDGYRLFICSLCEIRVRAALTRRHGGVTVNRSGPAEAEDLVIAWAAGLAGVGGS